MAEVTARVFNDLDNVAVILSPVSREGDTVIVIDESGNEVTRLTLSFAGAAPDRHTLQYHKVALAKVIKGAEVYKLGGLAGFATTAINEGDWVHTHNLGMGERKITPRLATSTYEDPPIDNSRTFMGIIRPDGRVATRNYVGITTTVNCSATTANIIAHMVQKLVNFSEYPNIDGIAVFPHKVGCGVDDLNRDLLFKTIRGHQRHPNAGLSVTLGLGCETCTTSSLVQLTLPGQEPLKPNDNTNLVVNIQDGDIESIVMKVVDWIKERLPELNDVKRVSVPLSHLKVLLKCGGSTAASGITANPATGYAADLLVKHGATVVLCETTECYGAEDSITSMAISEAVAEQFLDKIRWWEELAIRHHGTTNAINQNPSAGNKHGGLTTILEKSWAARMKAGKSRLRAVFGTCEQIEDHGFVFMDTQGFDPAAVTSGAAGGCNVGIFTTGKGTAINHKYCPLVKVGAEPGLFVRMPSIIDVNAGAILEGASVESVGEQIFESVISAASGTKVKAECLTIGNETFCAGDQEFCPPQPGMQL